MLRRNFINMLGAVAASAVLDPERLLWIPGKKRIFIPPQSTQNDLLLDEFIELLQPHQIIQRMSSLRRVPFDIKCCLPRP